MDKSKNNILTNVSPLLRAIIRTYQKDGKIVGEEANIGSTFLILCTKEFRRQQRLHEIVVNLSGAGKSTLVETVLEPFREHRSEDVIDIVRLTGPALERYENGMDGKILYLSQTIGNENEPTSMRPLLSEGKLGLLVMEKPEGKRKMESTIIAVKGMPVFISTSTDPQIDPELLRRVVQRTVDESPIQTERIKKFQAEQASSLDLPSLTRFRLIHSILEKIEEARPHNITKALVPYASEIEKRLPNDIEIRSKLPQFLKLIEAIALIKAVCYRGHFEVAVEKPVKENIRIVLATSGDFSDAMFVATASFFRLIPATASAILDYLSMQIESKVSTLTDQIEGYAKCTIKQIAKELKLPNSTIHKYAEALADKGLINKEKALNDKNVEVNLYQYSPLAVEDSNFELKDFDWKAWYNEQFTKRRLRIRYVKVDNPLELSLFSPFDESAPFSVSVEDSKNDLLRMRGEGEDYPLHACVEDTFHETKDSVKKSLDAGAN